MSTCHEIAMLLPKVLIFLFYPFMLPYNKKIHRNAFYKSSRSGRAQTMNVVHVLAVGQWKD